MSRPRKQPLLPLGLPPKPKRRVMARVSDAGEGVIRFVCVRCGWDSDWVDDTRTLSENRRGWPCPVCNGEGEG